MVANGAELNFVAGVTGGNHKQMNSSNECVAWRTYGVGSRRRHQKDMFRRGRLSRKRKFERKWSQCSERTVSIGIDMWKNTRRAHLQQQLSEVTVVQTLLPPGWFRVGDGAFGKVGNDPGGVLRLS
ncbi:hypothetical protein EMCRGX_G028525 [Ephydatia muelleri]